MIIEKGMPDGHRFRCFFMNESFLIRFCFFAFFFLNIPAFGILQWWQFNLLLASPSSAPGSKAQRLLQAMSFWFRHTQPIQTIVQFYWLFCVSNFPFWFDFPGDQDRATYCLHSRWERSEDDHDLGESHFGFGWYTILKCNLDNTAPNNMLLFFILLLSPFAKLSLVSVR